MKKQLGRVQRGFTLIELMIVVAIVGILAAIAVPQYQQYAIRARVTEGLSIGNAAKAAVSETVSNRFGEAIAAYTALAAPAAGSYGYSFTVPTREVASVAIAATAAAPVALDGRVTITYTAGVAVPTAPLVVSLTPGSGVIDPVTGLPAGAMLAAESIVWGCTINAAANFPFVPSNCRFLT